MMMVGRVEDFSFDFNSNISNLEQKISQGTYLTSSLEFGDG